MADVVTGADLARDQVGLTDGFAARRYFRKFDIITGHLPRVASAMKAEGRFTRPELDVLGDYVARIAGTFRALSTKYLFTGRDTGAASGALTIDNHESGFPVHREFLTMGADLPQAAGHLEQWPDQAALIDRMVAQIVGRLELPTRLQFALAQRNYYEALLNERLFWPQNDPRLVWLGGLGERRQFLVHWAVYDSQINLPVIYLMDLEDSGRTSLPKDPHRWPHAQAHLMAQSLTGLKLLTIARGFDEDFDDLHPKRIRRIHVGPMYSAEYTWQSGPISDVLSSGHAPDGQDWCLAWTEEELQSERVEDARKGWFGSVERQVFALDPFAARGVDTGATRTERSIILPQRPYQVLAEANPPGFREVRKFVVSPTGRVLSYR